MPSSSIIGLEHVVHLKPALQGCLGDLEKSVGNEYYQTEWESIMFHRCPGVLSTAQLRGPGTSASAGLLGFVHELLKPQPAKICSVIEELPIHR